MCLAGTPAQALASEPTLAPPAVSAPSVQLLTMDGQVLWSRRADEQRQVASTIKMLNALVVRERASLDETVVVPVEATQVDYASGLVAGERLTVRQLLAAMLLVSANDAAMTLAIHVGGTEERYVGLMNAKARELGLTHTVAVDPHGLSERELSTAADLSVIARKLFDDPALRAIVALPTLELPAVNGKVRKIENTNELVGQYPGMLGGKTGYTSSAGYCLVSSATRGDLTLMAVVLGAGSRSARFSQSRKLLDWGFGHFHRQVLVSAEPTGGVVKVADYDGRTVAVRPERVAEATLFDGAGPIERRVFVDEWASAPVARGQRVGRIEAYQDGKLLASVPLVAAEDVPVPPARERVYTLAVRVWDRALAEKLSPGKAWRRIRGEWPVLVAALRGTPPVAAASTAGD